MIDTRAMLRFSIEELLHIRRWAADSGARMVLRLDPRHGEDSYAETVSIHARGRTPILLLWRDDTAVCAEAVPGRALRFASVQQMMDRLHIDLGKPDAHITKNRGIAALSRSERLDRPAHTAQVESLPCRNGWVVGAPA